MIINKIKFLLLDYLFSTDSNMLKSLNEFKNVINTLTFSCDTIILPTSIQQYDHSHKLLVSSIINPLCTFGVSTEVEVQLVNIQQRNRNKLQQLQVDLKNIDDKLATEKYQQNTSQRTKTKDLTKVF